MPPLAQAHRRLLLLAMLQAGFAPMPSEWWHYSYGDCYWAAYAQQPQAIYGQV
nr:M15 family metallopeptidase [Allochromatium tepidum]